MLRVTHAALGATTAVKRPAASRPRPSLAAVLQATAKGKPSTSKEVLEEMMRLPGCPAVVRWIRDHRGNETFLDFLDDVERRLSHARPFPADCRSQSGGRLLRICPQVMTTNTETGRLAMDKPPLQKVPNARLVTGVSKGNGEPAPTFLSNIRSIFRAPQGFVILSADYRQIEMRIMAHLSNDLRLIDLLNNSPLDIFTSLAADTHGVDASDVTAQQRARIKTIFYGLHFGMGTRALANKLGCGENEAAQWSADCLGRYPEVCIACTQRACWTSA
jgi:DNA polymerase family A